MVEGTIISFFYHFYINMNCYNINKKELIDYIRETKHVSPFKMDFIELCHKKIIVRMLDQKIGKKESREREREREERERCYSILSKGCNNVLYPFNFSQNIYGTWLITKIQNNASENNIVYFCYSLKLVFDLW